MMSKIEIKKSKENTTITPGFATLQELFDTTYKKSRSGRYLAWRMSAGSYMKRFGLSYRDSNRISSFIYEVNGEEDPAFLRSTETWVREVALAKGSIGEILDAILILRVCQIDPERVSSCRSVRAEIDRYVRSHYPAV
ncbi:MAG: hypothetical protein EPO39_04570 [Candidatus Manganitrophaceae bacterium]|nr:MAG: hypothetical protein EPO39_04570 [Candidatus Manganitrophaceae bacterium]